VSRTIYVVFSCFNTIPACDRQADEQTDGQISRDSIVHTIQYVIASRGNKNRQLK